jgi:hypothetical protein
VQLVRLEQLVSKETKAQLVWLEDKARLEALVAQAFKVLQGQQAFKAFKVFKDQLVLQG